MMKYIVGFLIIAGLYTPSYGQNFDLGQSLSGELVRKDGQVLNGHIAMSDDWQAIMIKQDNAIFQMKAVEVESIFIPSEGIDYKSAVSQGEHFFFEVVLNGERPLLICEGKDLPVTSSTGFFTAVNGEFIPLDKGNDLFKVFGKFRKEMSDYVFSMALEPDENRRDLRMVFEYFNNHYAAQL
jgi:hypothetical protein